MCIVGRREELLAEVKAECWALRDPSVAKADISPVHLVKPNDPIIVIRADFTNVEDMAHLREVLKSG